MNKKQLRISFLSAALLPWLLFSDALHDNISQLLSRIGSFLSTKNSDSLLTQTRTNLIKVKGGTFYFGKFDTRFGEQRYAQLGFDHDLSPQEMPINDFSITKYQVTYSDYAIYTKANGKDPIEVTDSRQKELKEDHTPVLLTWSEAHGYCQWLGKLTGKSMDLPTEEQWEYAARSRGQFILYPTDTGIVEPGRNVPADIDKERIEDSLWRYKLMPVGKYPPNPLGLYDLASNGEEWTQTMHHNEDSEEYVVRSQSMSASGGAPTVLRRYDSSNDRNTARCVTIRD